MVLSSPSSRYLVAVVGVPVVPTALAGAPPLSVFAFASTYFVVDAAGAAPPAAAAGAF